MSYLVELFRVVCDLSNVELHFLVENQLRRQQNRVWVDVRESRLDIILLPMIQVGASTYAAARELTHGYFRTPAYLVFESEADRARGELDLRPDVLNKATQQIHHAHDAIYSQGVCFTRTTHNDGGHDLISLPQQAESACWGSQPEPAELPNLTWNGLGLAGLGLGRAFSSLGHKVAWVVGTARAVYIDKKSSSFADLPHRADSARWGSQPEQVC